ncbi:hypothetical protein L798_06849 [Zootermopsis nevadensis]|uniref:Uncharacterized protein n=1 Tax=Zootermopsis nevadensis TaxID=136037 RepID=A0A067QS19_ZOONE|nr:hypothetical protein L798_06849 [Zootermopsis nevadensis]
MGFWQYTDYLCLADTLAVVTSYSGAEENWLCEHKGSSSRFSGPDVHPS